MDVRIGDDDDGGPEAGRGRTGGTGGTGEAARRPARVRRLAAVAGVIAVGVAVTVAVTRPGGDDAPRPPLPTDLSATTSSLDEPLHELWRADDVDQVIAADDQVVAVGARSGHPAIRVYDAASGDLLWQREGARDESCTASDDESTVICTVASAVERAVGPIAEAPADVVVLDARTGAEVARTELPAPVLDVEALPGGDVLLVWVDTVGAVHAERWGPGPGPRWVADAEADALARIQAGGLVVSVAGEKLWFGAAGSPERDLGTGALAAAGVPASAPAWSTTTLSGGGRVDRVMEGRGERAHVFAPDGVEIFAVDGVPLEPSASDGAPHDVLVFQLAGGPTDASGDVAGLDAATGAERWRTHFPGTPGVAVRVADTVVLNASGRVVALDVATGRMLWDSSTSSWHALSVTDGRTLLVRTEAPDGAELHGRGSGDRRHSVEHPHLVDRAEGRGVPRRPPRGPPHRRRHALRARLIFIHQWACRGPCADLSSRRATARR